MDGTRRGGAGSAGSLAYARLLESLQHGVFAPGSRLPGERNLAEQVGVSRATLRQALTRLADEGRLSASSQRGWFVPRQVVGEPPSVLQSFTEMARARGLRASSHILHQRQRTVTMDEATRLRIAPAAPVLEIHRVRSMDGIPVCVDTSVVVAARARPIVDSDLTDRSLYEALETDCAVKVARSSYAVQAQAADEYVATLLDVPADAPVLVGQETTYDLDGVPILLSRTVYRGDAYRFEADLYRPLS